MTHEELLDAINRQIIIAPPFALGGYTKFLQGLSAVVELHKPMYYDTHPTLQCPCGHCEHREWDVWPCPTIQAIQEALK